MQPPTPGPSTFPEPFGTQDVIELPFTETILMARHLNVREIRSYMNQTPRNADNEHRVTAQGRDIYAIAAPIVVEAVERVCENPYRSAGAFALGQLVEASEFIQTLIRMGEILVLGRSKKRGSPLDEHDGWQFGKLANLALTLKRQEAGRARRC